MPKPSIQRLFGTSAAVSNGKLTIDFADFADTGWGTSTGVTDAEKWFVAILLKARSFTQGNTDQQPHVVVNAPFPGLTTRDSQLMREYSYSVQVYVPDTGSASPDPDEV